MPKQNLDRHINFLLLIGIMLVAANLRAPITSVGVALPSIKDTLHTTNSALSLMTVVPLIAFELYHFCFKNRQYIWIRTNNIWSFNLYIYRYFITVNNWIELALYWHNTHWHRYCLWQCISTSHSQNTISLSYWYHDRAIYRSNECSWKFKFFSHKSVNLTL